MKRLVFHLLTGLAVLLAASSVQAGNDRIFADGFDPCCSIGGTVSGLSGSGLVLHLAAGTVAEGKPIGDNGPYQFAASIPAGTVYAVSIDTQPGAQTCIVTNASGTAGSVDIDNVNVSCGEGLEWDSGNWGEPWQ